MTARKLTWRDVPDAQEMAAGGCRQLDLIREKGVSRSTAHRFGRRYGVLFPRGNRYDPDKRLAVIECVRRGSATCAAVARDLGVSKQAVHKMVLGLEAAGAIRRTGRSKGMRMHLTGDWRAL